MAKIFFCARNSQTQSPFALLPEDTANPWRPFHYVPMSLVDISRRIIFCCRIRYKNRTQKIPSPIYDANDSENKVVIKENISDKYEYLSRVSDYTMPVVSFSSHISNILKRVSFMERISRKYSHYLFWIHDTCNSR